MGTAKRLQSVSYVSGRRGQRSVADVMVEVLRLRKEEPVALSIEALAEGCRKILKQKIALSTVRSTLYRHTELFERESKKNSKPCLYRLTTYVLRLQDEQKAA